MADLNESQSSGMTKLIGSEPSGLEQGPVASSGAVPPAATFGLVVRPLPYELKTFVVCARNVTIANLKSMLAVLNPAGSGTILKIRHVKIINSQVSDVTGVVADFRFFRITGLSSGVALIPLTFDTADVLTGSIISATGGTITGEAPNALLRYTYSSDEFGPGTIDTESSDHTTQNVQYIYLHKGVEKPITLRPGEGLSVKQVTNSAVGTFDIEVLFTQEAL